MILDRCAKPKPAKGSAARARKEQRAKLVAFELAEKRAVRLRDRVCRWPRCSCHKLKLRLEVAHIVDKAQGGSSHRSNMILLCVEKHQGRPSLHSGDLAIRPQTLSGTEGCLDFYQRNEAGTLELIASERVLGVSVPRS